MPENWSFMATIASIGTVLLAVIAFFIRIQAQIDSKLSYARHEEICTASHNEKMKLLRELREMIESNDREARSERHQLRDDLHLLALRMEVIATIQGERDRRDRG